MKWALDSRYSCKNNDTFKKEVERPKCIQNIQARLKVQKSGSLGSLHNFLKFL